ncbi:MAG: hypothetical protein FWC27_14875 [Firmicutes bacterium]|nr:hypothetical protein [Bacillota bacterium]
MSKRDYTGSPAQMRATPQRFAIRKPIAAWADKAEELDALTFPALDDSQAALLPDFLPAEAVLCHTQSPAGVLWVGTGEGLWRVDPANPEPYDRVQCFRAHGYLLDNTVKSLQPDGNDGVFALTETGVSHIAFKPMSAQQKACLYSEINYRCMNRRGMLSGGVYKAEKKAWTGFASDNDGLWTSLVAMGDLCRYAVLRDDPKASPEDIQRAKELATLWTEACLLLCCIPGWKGTVPAFVRYNKAASNRCSKEYLIEGRPYATTLPENGPTGMVVHDPAPLEPADWAAADAMPEIVFRNAEGYIARTYHVNDPADDPVHFSDGVFFRKKYTPEGKLISVRVPTTTKKGDDMPPLLSVDSSLPIPERLRRLYADDGWNDDDITYKCDTSNDELVGHYAVWQLAYDILGPEDPELAQIISGIAARHAKHIAGNDFCHTDAGGQPTSWARMSREYYSNRGSDGFLDAPLGLSILLQLFKVAHHVTGDAQWHGIYRKLALDEPYRYADLLGEYYDRHVALGRELGGEEFSDEEMFHSIIQFMNYSDIRMSAISYYTLLQLERDPVLVEKYRMGADSWWKVLQYSRDVEWYLTYQLAHNGREIKDARGRPLAEVLAWQLSRFPVNPRGFRIDNATRPDAQAEGERLYDPATGFPLGLPMDERGSMGSDVYAAASGGMGKYLQKSYNMIMPYWLGRYHGLLADNGADGPVGFEDMMELAEQDIV